MELSKASDCLPNDLLITKLEAYGLGTESLLLLMYYLKKETISQDKGNQMFLPINKIGGPTRVNLWINSLQYLHKLFTLSASK